MFPIISKTGIHGLKSRTGPEPSKIENLGPEDSCGPWIPAQRYSDPCHDCTENSSCTNLPGSFRCVCDTGYEKSSDSTCVDINECDETIPCHPRAFCNNTMGSFTCKCDTGLRGNGIDICLDINECDEGIHECPKTSKCINNIGDYRCECNHGYDGEDCTGSTTQSTRLIYPV